MTINTKLNVGDECFLLFENKVKQGIVQDINTFTDLVSPLSDAHKTVVTYSIEIDDELPLRRAGDRSMVLDEPNVFSTKAELLASL